MKFLFWNIRKKSIGSVISEVVEEHKVDVVILAECSDEVAILSALNAETSRLFYLTDSNKTKVVIYTRFSREFIQSMYNDRYFTVRQVSLTERREALLPYTSQVNGMNCTEIPEIGRNWFLTCHPGSVK
jgi:hypothetical protein